jgi:hypothetical protein
MTGPPGFIFVGSPAGHDVMAAGQDSNGVRLGESEEDQLHG